MLHTLVGYPATMSQQDQQALEALLRQLIFDHAEGKKVDFKSDVLLNDKKEQAELAKDVAAIANTDDEGRHGDTGYIIIGARRGELLGGVRGLDGDEDHLQAKITQVLAGYLSTVPPFTIRRFRDEPRGTWGVVVIHPSTEQPHVLIRDAGDEVVKHEWWVRVNDTNQRATAGDYGRFLEKAVARRVKPLEAEVRYLAGLVEGLREWRPDRPDAAAPSPGMEADAPGLVRAAFDRPDLRAERAMLQLAARIEAELSRSDNEQLPWLFYPEVTNVRASIEYMEDLAWPLAEAVCIVARDGHSGKLNPVVVDTLSVLAREPEAQGHHHDAAVQLRLYPLVLCLHALAMVAVSRSNIALLSSIFDATLEHRRGVEPIIVSLRRVEAAGRLFADGSASAAPPAVGRRLLDVLPPRLGGLVAPVRPRDAFYLAEFVLALKFLTSPAADEYPFPLGTYAFFGEARSCIEKLLVQQPQWLDTLLGVRIDEAARKFDIAAGRAWPNRHFYLRAGFAGGAEKAVASGKTARAR